MLPGKIQKVFVFHLSYPGKHSKGNQNIFEQDWSTFEIIINFFWQSSPNKRATLDIICQTAMGTCVEAQSDPDNQYLKDVCQITEITSMRAVRITFTRIEFWHNFSASLFPDYLTDIVSLIINRFVLCNKCFNSGSVLYVEIPIWIVLLFINCHRGSFI